MTTADVQKIVKDNKLEMTVHRTTKVVSIDVTFPGPVSNLKISIQEASNPVMTTS